MASPDVVNSILQELLPGMSEQFTSWHPLIERVHKAQQFQQAKGRKVEFRIVTGGPGQMTPVNFGGEQIPRVRRQNYTLGEQFMSRSLYSFIIPGKDLAEVSGDKDAMKSLIQAYPESAVSDVYEILSRQIARGASSAGTEPNPGSDASGYTTLNGDQSYYPDGPASTTSGVFQPLAPGSQTNTVFGRPMSGAAVNPTPGWEHQYGHITNFALNGRKTMQDVKRAADRKGNKFERGVDLLIGDEASFANYVESLDDHVETVAVVDDHVPAKVRDGVKFMGADFFSESDIDLTDTTAFTSALMQSGVIYMLCTPTWEGRRMGNDDSMETKGLLSMRGPIRVPDMDAWQWEIVNHFNMYCKELRKNGLVTGGAV